MKKLNFAFLSKKHDETSNHSQPNTPPDSSSFNTPPTPGRKAAKLLGESGDMHNSITLVQKLSHNESPTSSKQPNTPIDNSSLGIPLTPGRKAEKLLGESGDMLNSKTLVQKLNHNESPTSSRQPNTPTDISSLSNPPTPRRKEELSGESEESDKISEQKKYMSEKKKYFETKLHAILNQQTKIQRSDKDQNIAIEKAITSLHELIAEMQLITECKEMFKEMIIEANFLLAFLHEIIDQDYYTYVVEEIIMQGEKYLHSSLVSLFLSEKIKHGWNHPIVLDTIMRSMGFSLQMFEISNDRKHDNDHENDNDPDQDQDNDHAPHQSSKNKNIIKILGRISKTEEDLKSTIHNILFDLAKTKEGKTEEAAGLKTDKKLELIKLLAPILKLESNKTPKEQDKDSIFNASFLISYLHDTLAQEHYNIVKEAIKQNPRLLETLKVTSIIQNKIDSEGANPRLLNRYLQDLGIKPLEKTEIPKKLTVKESEGTEQQDETHSNNFRL